MEKTDDLVRNVTDAKQNRSIDEKSIESLKELHGKSKWEIRKRIEELDAEWDIERVLQLNAAALALTGVLLGLKDKRWTILTGVVGAFLIQHSIQGWCPPVELFRAIGFRTRKEIDREKYALKTLRGDFKHAESARDAWVAAE